MKGLLEKSIEQLNVPAAEARRKLLIILNLIYILCAIFFLSFEKASTGSFVPKIELFYFVYLPALLANFSSAAYNTLALKYHGGRYPAKTAFIYYILVEKGMFFDRLSAWFSLGCILFMSFMNMMGFGNPSNDAILTDYALAHSLIIVAVILLGRKAAIAWFIIVLATLLYNVGIQGYNYQYHYLTPTEVEQYESSLAENERWALARNVELIDNGLNPPKVSRYFNTWIIFIVTSFVCAYFFSGITIDILKIIPPVVNNIEKAIESNFKTQMELGQKQKEATSSAVRIVRNNDILEMLNKEMDKLDYRDKDKFRNIIAIIRKELNIQQDWETFKINFDSLHSGFFKFLEDNYNYLSDSEKRHLAYIKMNLSHLDIAKFMDVKLESLRASRYRLKQRLALGKGEDLSAFVKSIKL